MDRNRDLTSTLEIFQSRRNGIRTEQVKMLLARVRVNDVGYVLIESKLGDSQYESECEWYKDS